MADSMTQVQRAGQPGEKNNLVVIGDGYSAAEQSQFNDYVRETIMRDLFERRGDYFYEDAQAFNIFRVNLESNDSGVTRHTYDGDGNLTTVDYKDTALDTIYSGVWSRCWIENGPNTTSRLNAALASWVPDWTFVLVVQNQSGFGGCARGNKLYVTKAVSWSVVAHEFGHGFGSLADEYAREGTYAGGEPGAVNVTKNTNRNTLKWNQYVRPSTPVPTGINANPGNGSNTNWNQGAKPSWWDSALDAGLFEGAQYRDKGLFRPAENCRMRGNSPPFCPVCYSEMKRIQHSYTKRTFENVYTGDFNGDGKDEVLVHNDNSIQIYRPIGRSLELVHAAVERVPGSWQFKADDQFYIGDFNGDGKDEVLVYNSTNWNQKYLGLLVDDGDNGLRLIRRYANTISGWNFAKHDRFYVADFNGDGKQDLLVFNGKDWNVPYLGMFRSTGSGFSVVRRYDGDFAGWQMRANDQFLIGDFNGDGKDDVYVFNGLDWSTLYLTMMRSDSNAFTQIKRYDNTIPGWQMAKGDKYYAADFNGDGRKDLYVFNGTNWNTAYLAMLSSNGTSLSSVRRYDGNAPGWQMRKNDRHWVAEIEGNGREDLFVYNHEDWDKEYLGTMRSEGSSLTCSFKEDWVGEWNLGSSDRFEVCNIEGGGRRRNLIVHNQNWLGMMRALPSLSLMRLYNHWIHNYRYGRNW